MKVIADDRPRRADWYVRRVVTSNAFATIDDLEERFASDELALHEAYRHYGSMVFTLCRRSLSEADAREATQDTFVAAWRNRHRYDVERASLAGWLMAIARNKVIDCLRRGQRTPTTESIAVDNARPGDSQRDLDRVVDSLLVADLLSSLGPRPRQVLELAFFEGLSLAEVAERCEQPLGTVKSDYRRSLQRLRRQMEAHHV